MASVPQGIRSVVDDWSEEFAATVWPKFQVLLFAATLCVGRYTVCRLLRIAGALAATAHMPWRGSPRDSRD